MSNVRVISDDQVKSVLKMEDAIPVVERVLLELAQQQATNIPRTTVETEIGVFRFMAAHVPSIGLIGINQGYWSSEFRGDKEKARASGILAVYDSKSGGLISVVETPTLNEIRTGAVSGVAAKHLAPPSATSIGVIGSSRQARAQLLGVCAVRDVDEIRVYSRNRANCARFCQEMGKETDVRLIAVESSAEATSRAEIVLEATDAIEPVIDGRALAEGCYVSSIKTGRHGSRQLDDETVRRSSPFVIDSKEQAIIDGAGDVFGPIMRGILEWGRIVELGSVISKEVPGRQAGPGITVFKSCGMAINDLALARLAIDRLTP